MVGLRLEKHTITRRALEDIRSFGRLNSMHEYYPGFDKCVVVMSGYDGTLYAYYFENHCQGMMFASSRMQAYYRVELWMIWETDEFLNRVRWIESQGDVVTAGPSDASCCEMMYMITPVWREYPIMVLWNNQDDALYMPKDAQGESPTPSSFELNEWEWVCVGYCDGEFPKDAYWRKEYEPWRELAETTGATCKACQSRHDVELEACHA